MKIAYEDQSKFAPVLQTRNLFIKENQLQHQIFTIRYSELTFMNNPTSAIIFQDQTSIIELKALDEKYQRIYLASVVHDIRTPLNGILGMLEMVEQL